VPDLPPALASFVADAARDLRAARGRALVLAGDRQPAEVHAFAAWANGVLAAPVDWIVPIDADPTPHRAGLAALAADMHAGRIDTLVVIDANPCYAADPAVRFAEAMTRVPLTVAVTRVPDETSARAMWQLPLSHPLEGWHDWRATDGTASIAQPLVRPFWDTRTPSDVVDLILDPVATPRSYAAVRERWAALGEDGWRRAVAAGVVPGRRVAPVTVGPAPLVLPPIPAAGPAVTIAPSPALYDGRYASNAWAQETPDPLTKEVWGASVRMHPVDMAALGAKDGDLVRVTRGGSVTLAVRGHAGQARGCATLLAGHGRSASGAVADGVGANAWVLDTDAPVRIGKAEGRAPVVSTQHQFALDGDLAKLFPVLRPGEAMPRPEKHATLLPNSPTRSAPKQWAMAIDTDVCIGCNACVVACQAENNVPAIGPAEMAVGRDMHWLRVDRYEADGASGFQPVPCMQCEAAPCEPVCPVEASVHDDQGLNLQVYNRCIGTRTCQANCPYKVRRFNFRDYAGASLWGKAEDASISAQRNPDVTVRARGVMEKCTYCVQRISASTREGDAGGIPGEVVTACQAACPTQAITFGPLGAPAIETARADPRHYALLEELGTRPRTTYLARRRNDGGAA
jgi:molybdopterin-containing oxidoreductase family iron-sulfur binding subunit